MEKIPWERRPYKSWEGHHLWWWIAVYCGWHFTIYDPIPKYADEGFRWKAYSIKKRGGFAHDSGWHNAPTADEAKAAAIAYASQRGFVQDVPLPECSPTDFVEILVS